VKATVICAVLVLVLAGAALTGIARGSDSHSSCRLSIAPGPGWSEATGQHTLAFVLTNRGTSTCALDGYPHVEFRDAHGRLPFVIRHGGDQMLTKRPPARVRFAPGGRAYAAVNKYRCDLGDKREPTRAVLVPPGGGTPLSIRVTGWFFGWCGFGDPGSTVSVTPIEATPNALARRR
jgi:hypothetical protein